LFEVSGMLGEEIFVVSLDIVRRFRSSSFLAIDTIDDHADVALSSLNSF